jgi:hypothetical protein
MAAAFTWTVAMFGLVAELKAPRPVDASLVAWEAVLVIVVLPVFYLSMWMIAWRFFPVRQDV